MYIGKAATGWPYEMSEFELMLVVGKVSGDRPSIDMSSYHYRNPCYKDENSHNW